MESIILLSPQSGAGVNTIAVNLGIGLARADSVVRLLSNYDRLSDWLTSPGNKHNSLLDRNPCFDWQSPSSNTSGFTAGKTIDYLLHVPQSREMLAALLNNHTTLILCVIDGANGDIKTVLDLEEYVKTIRKDAGGIDLIVPNKIKPGEWSENSQLIFDLAEELGWDKIADPIPYCEAIHDLPKENQSVWELPSQYKNRQAAFQSLVDKILEMD